MIKYNPKDWFGLIFQFHRSDTFRKMLWVLLAFMIYATIIVYLNLNYKEWFSFKSTTTIHSLLGFVIGLLLVFRTNTAYERWWEGRKQWGALVNNTRNLAIKLVTMVPENQGHEKVYLSKMIANYVFALKEHLRKGLILDELDVPDEHSKEEFSKTNHSPNWIAGRIYQKINTLYKEKHISGDQLIILDKEIKSFTDITGACERIKNTPIPYSYNLFLKKFIFVYTITMPFGLVSDFNYWTIPIVTFILYIFGSLELLAEEIEDPFGTDTNDLPTDDLARKIKANVSEIFNV